MKKVLWLLVLSILFLVGCEEEQVQYQEQPTQEKIYVQDDSGKWMEYAVLIALLNSQGRQFDERHYHYGTGGCSIGQGGCGWFLRTLSGSVCCRELRRLSLLWGSASLVCITPAKKF